MMGMNGRVDMEPSGNAWSTLGSSMLLPSTLSAAIEQLKLSLRDMSLEHATTTAGLKLEIAELRGELRALGRTSREDKDEFNAFAYVSPEEIGIVTEIVKPDMTGVKRVSGFVVPAPELEDIVADAVEVPIRWWDGLDEEGITFELANLVVEHVSHSGPILNNRLWKDVYPEGLEITKGMKSGVKKILAAVSGVSYHKVDTFRGMYYDSNMGAGNAYKQLTGKELDS
jgi:hypothetical protein